MAAVSMKLFGPVFSLTLFFSLAITSKAATPAASGQTAWLSFNGGVAGIFDSENPPVFSVQYRFAEKIAFGHPWVELSWATDGAIFAGAGFAYSVSPDVTRKWEYTAGVGPGYYDRHQGVNLGSHLEFLSFLEVAYRLDSGNRFQARLAHISNGGVSRINPGTELLMLGFAIPLR